MRLFRRRPKPPDDFGRRVPMLCGLLQGHDECTHHDSGAIEAPEGVVQLCPCACHASCPLAGRDSVDEMTWRSTCTCPGAETIRRNQDLIERMGIDPSRLAQIREAARREWPGDEATRKERVKEHLAQAYRAAAAQVAGRPLLDAHLDNPRQAMPFLVDQLARMESDAAAARLLGLTDAQVAEARTMALEFRLRQVRAHLEREIGPKRADRVIRRMRQAEGGRQ